MGAHVSHTWAPACRHGWSRRRRNTPCSRPRPPSLAVTAFHRQVSGGRESIEVVPQFFAESHVNSLVTVEPSALHLSNEKCISFTTQMY